MCDLQRNGGYPWWGGLAPPPEGAGEGPAAKKILLCSFNAKFCQLFESRLKIILA